MALTTRSDDTPEAITTRLKVQGDHLNSIIKFFQDEGVTVQFINGNQSFEQVHEAIKAAMDQ